MRMKKGSFASGVYGRSKETMARTRKMVINTIDQNGDGQIGIDDIIIAALKAPGVRVSRAAFLQKELFKHYPQEVVDLAIASNPAQAGVSLDVVDHIADDVIRFERNCVSGVSAALGVPGGWAMAATIPTDMIQYYGYTLRAAQKLLYLYGFPEIETDEEGLQLDSGTINTIVLCLGVMNGVAGANNAVNAMAHALAAGVEKQLMKRALTKGTIYPIVRSVAKWFGVKLTKSVFTGAIKKAIPVVGGVVGGGITFVSFQPCCKKLKDALKDTRLSNPQHALTEEEAKLFEDISSGEIIDVEVGCEMAEENS